jgi:hypothetical protein
MSKILSHRPSVATVVAFLALFVALGGPGWAAKKLKLKNNSVTTPKIKDAAVTNPKLADDSVTTGKIVNGAVTTPKLADRAVTTDKIADSAVTAGKLEASQRSETFEAHTAGLSGALATPIGGTKTVLQTLVLPAGGKYFVTGEAELFNGAATLYHANCALSGVNGSANVGETATGQPDLLFGSGGVSVSGISNGGSVTLSCSTDTASIFAGNRNLDAVRAG